MLDKSEILDRLGGNEKLFLSVSKRFADSVPEQLQGIESSVQACDRQALLRWLHRLKGSLAYFDDGAVAVALHNLEQVAKQEAFDQECASRFSSQLAQELTLVTDSLRRLLAD